MSIHRLSMIGFGDLRGIAGLLLTIGGIILELGMLTIVGWYMIIGIISMIFIIIILIAVIAIVLIRFLLMRPCVLVFRVMIMQRFILIVVLHNVMQIAMLAMHAICSRYERHGLYLLWGVQHQLLQVERSKVPMYVTLHG